MKTKNREQEVYEAVKLGLMEVEEDGSIWKIGEIRGNRWNSVVTFRRVPRRRAEHDAGAYLMVRRMTGAMRSQCLAHRMVWLHFFGPIPDGKQINHINGRKKDNRPSNLELVTPSGNVKHAYRTGLKDEHGQRNPAAKITDAQVEAMRRIYAAGGVTQAVLATRFGIRFQQVSRIVRGDRRPKQTGPIADYTHRRQHGGPRDTKGRFRGA